MAHVTWRDVSCPSNECLDYIFWLSMDERLSEGERLRRISEMACNGTNKEQLDALRSAIEG